MIPAELSRFFWDTDPQQIDPMAHAAYVISRLFENGDMAAVNWMLATYSQSTLTDILKRTRELSPRSATFWALYFDLQPDEVPCIQKSWHQQRLGASPS